MTINNLITGNFNISIPFMEYFNGLSGNAVILSSNREYISIEDTYGKEKVKVYLGSSLKKFFTASHKTNHLPDSDFYGSFGVLMNGFNGRDWLFIYDKHGNINKR